MNSKAKVIVAVICLAAAGILVAMNLGLFGDGKPKRTGTAANTAPATTTNADGTEALNDNATPPAGQLKKDNF